MFIAAILAIVAALMGLGWLSFGLYYGLMTMIGRPAAMIVVGGLFLAAAALTALVFALRRRPAGSRDLSMADVVRAAEILTSESPYGALALFGLAGFALGARPELALRVLQDLMGAAQRTESPP